MGQGLGSKAREALQEAVRVISEIRRTWTSSAALEELIYRHQIEILTLKLQMTVQRAETLQAKLDALNEHMDLIVEREEKLMLVRGAA